MKATGIVRRIDDLGRVVIPKEIRRTLRIREGDPLEIFVDREGEVILKKYSPISELGQFATEYAEALYDALQHPIFICDRDQIIAIAGESKKDYLNKDISTQISEMIENRSPIFETEGSSVEIIQNQQESLDSYCINPIVSNGDSIGCVMIFTRDDGPLSEVEQKTIETAANFLGKQME